MGNIYKILENEHHVVDSGTGHEVSVPEIFFWKYLKHVLLMLRNCKKLKRRKIVRFKISSILSLQLLIAE